MLNTEAALRITGEIDACRLIAGALERLVDGDAEASYLLADLRQRLTALADEIEPGEPV